jgi:hypothetical protein
VLTTEVAAMMWSRVDVVGWLALAAVSCTACSLDSVDGVVSQNEVSVYSQPFDTYATVNGSGTHMNTPKGKWTLPQGSKVTIECQVTKKTHITYPANPMFAVRGSSNEVDTVFLKVSYDGGSGYVDSRDIQITSRDKQTNQEIAANDVNSC